MAREYTADELIAIVRRRAFLPDTNSLGTQDADILAALNEEMLTELVPLVIRVREEYFVVRERVAATATDGRHRINGRAIGVKLRDVAYVGNGSTTARVPLTYIHPEEDPGDLSTSTGYPGGFFIEGNNVVLSPNLGAGTNGLLELPFFFRPGELVLQSAVRKITAVNTTLKRVTVASSPSTWTTSDKFDIHSGKSGAEIHLWDLTPDGSPASTTTVTFNEAIDGSSFGTFTAEVGDYLCLAEQAALPGLPRELHPILAQAVVVQLVESLGDVEMFQIQERRLETMKRDILPIIENRVEGRPRKIVGRDAPLWGSTRSVYYNVSSSD